MTMKSEDRSDIRLASLLAIYRRFIIIIYLLICWFNIVVCLVWTSFSYLLYCWLCEIELVKRCNIFFLRLSSFRFDLKIKILYFTISDRTNFKGLTFSIKTFLFTFQLDGASAEFWREREDRGALELGHPRAGLLKEAGLPQDCSGVATS